MSKKTKEMLVKVGVFVIISSEVFEMLYVNTFCNIQNV